MNSLKVFSLTLLSILLLTVSLQAKSMTALVRSIEGFAEYAVPGSDQFQPLQRSRRLKPGTTIKTGPGAVVILRVVPGAAMRIAENTTLVLDEMAFEKEGEKVKLRKATISLKSGTVSSLLDEKDPKATDFRIKTPQGSAAARGTFYGVTVEDGQSFVSVKEGKVGLKLEEKKK